MGGQRTYSYTPGDMYMLCVFSVSKVLFLSFCVVSTVG